MSLRRLIHAGVVLLLSAGVIAAAALALVAHEKKLSLLASGAAVLAGKKIEARK